MMKEEDDLELPPTPEMADVGFVVENGPNSNSTVLLAAAGDSQTKEEDSVINSVSPQQEMPEPSEKTVTGPEKDSLMSSDMKQISEDGAPETNNCGGNAEQEKPSTEISFAADKSKELFGDSEGGDAFGIVPTEKEIPKNNSASKLFADSTSTSNFFIGQDLATNESFEIIGANQSMESIGKEVAEKSESVQMVSYGTDVKQGMGAGCLESSFDNLDIAKSDSSVEKCSPGVFEVTSFQVSKVNAAPLVTNPAPGSVNNAIAAKGTIQEPIPQYQGGSFESLDKSSGYSSQLSSHPSYPVQQAQYTQQSQSQGYPAGSYQQQSTGKSDSFANQGNMNQYTEQSTGQTNNAQFQYAQNQSQNMMQTNQEASNYQAPIMTAVQQGQVNYNTQQSANIPLFNPASYNSGFTQPDSPNTPSPNANIPSVGVGNSYMYTSPISSVMPGHNTAKNSSANQDSPASVQQYPAPPAAQQANGLFVPDLYATTSATTPTGKVDIFVPTAPVLQVEHQPPAMAFQNNAGNNYSQNRPSPNFSPEMAPFRQIPLSMSQGNFDSSQEDPGLLGWVKQNMNQDWSGGAKKLGQQIFEKTKNTIEWFGDVINDGGKKLHPQATKNATETVLTTLDPGMEEYLNPVLNLAIATSDDKIINGIRQGFRSVFGHTAARGHMAQHSLANLPIGFEAGVRAAKERLDVISNVNFQFNGEYIAVSTSPFLTELDQGRWSCMFCIALRNLHRRIELHSFSQPISIPSACVNIAYNKTHPDEIQQKLGYSVTIDDAIRLFKPYPPDQDWCYTLTGMTLESLLTSASQGLAADYRREMENPSTNSTESIAIFS